MPQQDIRMGPSPEGLQQQLTWLGLALLGMVLGGLAWRRLLRRGRLDRLEID